MLKTRWLQWSVLLWSCVLLAHLTPPAVMASQDSRNPGASRLDEIEMGIQRGKDIVPRSAAATDDETSLRFKREYFSAGGRKRPVFAKYLSVLGAEKILDVLEAIYPLCHGEAHELGQAIFARVKEINLALRECKTRCTTGCMHGVLMEAFGKATLLDVTTQMVSFCGESELTQMHRSGNCAHGMGHALMISSGHDIQKSLTACSSFPNLAMEYYCATGVFMEHMMTGKSKHRRPESLHSPCDLYTRYPAACYRYKVPQLLHALGGDTDKIVDACSALAPALRLGCFHGVGAAHIRAIARKPGLLSTVCRHGTPDERVICIEGAIEALAEFDEPRAMAACATLDGESAVVCSAAARGKMYSLTKPSMALYYSR